MSESTERIAELEAQIARVKAIRWRCPLHDMPDCSPLLNGCVRVLNIYRAIDRALAGDDR